MNIKEHLILIVKHLIIEENDFLNKSIACQDKFQSSFVNWSFTDVLAHNSEWRSIASNKIRLIKHNEHVEFREDLDIVNKSIYERHSEISFEDATILSKNSIESLVESINLFNDPELQEQGKLLGWIGPLWKYIVYYGFIHPIKHIVFYYIKKQEFLTAFQRLEANYMLMSEFHEFIEMTQSLLTKYIYFFDGLDNKDEILTGLKHFYANNLKCEEAGNSILRRFMLLNDFK